MDGQSWIDDLLHAYRAQRNLCERALAQVTNDDLFESPYRGAPSLAVLMKHLGGNLRSRMHEFLTTDGEKADRNRDGEFDVSKDTPGSIRAVWDRGWDVTLSTVEALVPTDLERTITIRGEPLGVVAALQRNLTHTAYHTGQIVTLSRHLVGDAWSMLSIPPGESEAFNAKMRERFPQVDS